LPLPDHLPPDRHWNNRWGTISFEIKQLQAHGRVSQIITYS
jgi:hypothetical protein